MRPIYQIEEESKVTPELMQEIGEDIEYAIERLSEYLEDFVPERRGPRMSKSSVMGPVGKLLSAINSTKLETKDALIGYVVNIHQNTSGRRLTDKGRENLEKGVERLLSLKEKAPKRIISRAMQEIDYGVYKRKLEYIIQKHEEKSEKEE